MAKAPAKKPPMKAKAKLAARAVRPAAVAAAAPARPRATAARPSAAASAAKGKAGAGKAHPAPAVAAAPAAVKKKPIASTSSLALKTKRPLVETKAVRKVVKPLQSNKPHNHFPPVVLPPAPVSTDGKPRKNQAGLSSKELEHFRELLLLKRRELVGDMSSMEREALRSTTGTNLSNLPMHMADMGTDNYEQEFTLGLVEKDRQLLREINIALAKIQNGTYGICEGTGKPISKPRLEAQPWAKYSIDYARVMESRSGSGFRR